MPGAGCKCASNKSGGIPTNGSCSAFLNNGDETNTYTPLYQTSKTNSNIMSYGSSYSRKRKADGDTYGGQVRAVKVLPNAFKYSSDVPEAPSGEYELVRIPPVTPQSLGPGANMQFNIPNDGIYDLTKCFLIFKAAVTKTGGTAIAFDNHINSIFNRLVIRVGGEVVEDITNYNHLAVLLESRFQCHENVAGAFDDVGVSVTVANFMARMMGYGMTNTIRETMAGTVGATVDYAVPLHSGFLAQKPLPTKCMGAKGVQIELWLEQANRCVYSADATAATYTISNMYLYCPAYKQSDICDSIDAQLSSSPIIIRFPVWRNYQDTVNGATTITTNITERSNNLKHIMWTMRASSRLNDLASDYKMQRSGNHNISSYQAQVNGCYVPIQAVDCTTSRIEPYMHYLHAADKWRSYTGAIGTVGVWPITQTGWDATDETAFANFFCNLNLESFPHSGLVSGVSTANNTGQLLIKTDFSASQSGLQIDYWVLSDRVFILDSQGGKLAY